MSMGRGPARRPARSHAGAVLLLLLAAAWSHGCRRAASPSVLLISIDTLRADRVGAYGARRPTTPVIDALAARGVLYEHAIAQAPWTLPSIASLLTSLYPSEHGATGAATRLPDSVETLAEALQARGYHTMGIVSHSFLDGAHGMAQGFERYDESQALGHDAVTSEPLTARAVEFLRGVPRRQPFFLWVHYFDPHFTYVRHPEYAFADGYAGALPAALPAGLLNALAERGNAQDDLGERDLDYVKAVYDEEVASTDRWIGRLLAELRALGREDSTLVVLTADHGEYFLDRGRFFHGREVYEPLVHVPLVIGGAVPERLRGRRVKQTVELASVPKTVMDRLAAPNGFGGIDLLALAEGTSAQPDAAAFSEGSYAWGTSERRKAILWHGFKLVHNIDGDSFELYRLAEDPGERRNLWTDDRKEIALVREALKRRLELFPSRHGATSPIELTPEAVERLRTLGYVE